MKYKVAPSLMCCDFFHFGEQIAALEGARVELLHVDIMDGRFVPNLALGTDFVRQLKAHTRVPLDLHFMVEEPERMLDAFTFGEGDYVSIHAESTPHLLRALQAVRARGAKALAALNPGTPETSVADALAFCDGLLVMTVDPGYAGQKMTPLSLEKIARVRAWLDRNGRPDAEIEVDGNVSLENAPRMKKAGADIFVAGSSGVFMEGDPEENVRKFRETIENGGF